MSGHRVSYLATKLAQRSRSVRSISWANIRCWSAEPPDQQIKSLWIPIPTATLSRFISILYSPPISSLFPLSTCVQTVSILVHSRFPGRVPVTAKLHSIHPIRRSTRPSATPRTAFSLPRLSSVYSRKLSTGDPVHSCRPRRETTDSWRLPFETDALFLPTPCVLQRRLA